MKTFLLDDTTAEARATETMRAAVVHDFSEPARIEELPKPVAGPGEVVVRIEASGLCHTDIHAAHGDWPVKPKPPFVPGHEGVGIVESIGAGVTEARVGDRVAIPWLGYACGTCDYCVSGWETLCESQLNTGYSVDGGFAEYAKAYARLRRPGARRRRSARRGAADLRRRHDVQGGQGRRRQPAQLVAIFGIGGLGHLALQYARIAGASVVAVDVDDEKLELARELGADPPSTRPEQDPVAAIKALGGADVAVVLAVAPKAFEQAFASLRRGGTLVLVALPHENTMELPIFETVLNGITVVGSIVGTRVDLREVFALHAAGKTRVIREERQLDEVETAMEDVLRGDVPARIVFQP